MQDFSEYCEIEKGLTYKVAKDYRNTIKRSLKNSKGAISRGAIRQHLKFYLENRTAKTYNNNLDGIRAFVERYLGRPEFTAGFKHRHVPNNYEEPLPTEAELRRGFDALDTDQERAIYLFYATTGLRRTEILDLSKDDIDRGARCVKSKHDTRTKKAGITFYNDECE